VLGQGGAGWGSELQAYRLIRKEKRKSHFLGKRGGKENRGFMPRFCPPPEGLSFFEAEKVSAILYGTEGKMARKKRGYDQRPKAEGVVSSAAFKGA